MGSVITLKGGRGSFLTLAEPEFFGGVKSKPTDKRRWSGTLLLPYKDPQIEALDAIIEEVGKAKWEKKWATIRENVFTTPNLFFKMDGKRKDYAGYEGHWALSAHRNEDKGRPLVLDSDKTPIFMSNNELAPGKGGRLYSGVFMNMQLEVWAQDNPSGKGIRATLLGIQRVRDGDAFAGGAAPNADAFDEIEEGADADDLT